MNTDPVMVILSFLQRICNPETLRQLCLVLLALYLALPINAVGGKGLGLEGKVSVNKTTEKQQNKQSMSAEVPQLMHTDSTNGTLGLCDL